MENIKFIPKVETKIKNKYFIKILLSIYTELPKPLQLDNNFNKSIRNSNIILITLRIGNKNGQVIGFAKGAPLEKYKFRQKINDKNFGIENTVFLEPIALKSGYWGLHGGSDMRYLFIHEARKKFKFLTSFALRNVIKNRIIKNSNIEFVTKFNPEHWDYYRIKL